MSNGKVFQSLGAATLNAREIEDNFFRETTSKCSSANRKDLVGVSAAANSNCLKLRFIRMTNGIVQQCNVEIDTLTGSVVSAVS